MLRPAKKMNKLYMKLVQSGEYSLLLIASFLLLQACVNKKETLNIKNIKQTDSILYNSHRHKSDSIIIKNKAHIRKIVNLLSDHTYRYVSTFPVNKKMTFFIGDKQEYILISGKGVKYDGEYRCDIDIEAFMDSLLNK